MGHRSAVESELMEWAAILARSPAVGIYKAGRGLRIGRDRAMAIQPWVAPVAGRLPPRSCGR